MNLIPLYEKIVVKLKDKQEMKSKAGLSYTADLSLSKNTSIIADVIAVGKGRLLSNGQILPLIVKVGDEVVFSKMQGDSYTDGEDEYVILSESCILAIKQKEEENENN